MKKEDKRILVPVDFNGPSLKAVEFAHQLADEIKGEIALLYVIETPGILADFFASGDHLVRITEQVKERLYSLTEEIRKKDPDIQITSTIERGKPYEKILEVASRIKATTIILGENHQGEDHEQDLGSTVFHVTLKSPVPVLTLKGDAKHVGRRILVPLDLTKETQKQLLSALTYGRNYGATIILVSALVTGMNVKDSLIYKKLEQARRVLKENGVNCEVKLFEHSSIPPYSRVLEYADEIKAEMIMVMTHQEGYTHDNYIGAFAHHIINRSRVPVLSLTSSATGSGLTKIMKSIVDPVGWFKK